MGKIMMVMALFLLLYTLAADGGGPDAGSAA